MSCYVKRIYIYIYIHVMHVSSPICDYSFSADQQCTSVFSQPPRNSKSVVCRVETISITMLFSLLCLGCFIVVPSASLRSVITIPIVEQCIGGILGITLFTTVTFLKVLQSCESTSVYFVYISRSCVVIFSDGCLYTPRRCGDSEDALGTSQGVGVPKTKHQVARCEYRAT